MLSTLAEAMWSSPSVCTVTATLRSSRTAQRVLYELTGLNELHLIQFRAFGSKNRTNNPKDTKWLERFHQLNQKVERIVTITYLTMVKIDKKLTHLSDRYEACWTDIDALCPLAFDHNQIIGEALWFVRQYVQTQPAALFDRSGL